MTTAGTTGLFGSTPTGGAVGTTPTATEQKISGILQQLSQSKAPLPETLMNLSNQYPSNSSERIWLQIGATYLQRAEEQHKKIKAGIIAFLVILILIIIGILIATSLTARYTHH
jgi:hypothetical protein